MCIGGINHSQMDGVYSCFTHITMSVCVPTRSHLRCVECQGQQCNATTQPAGRASPTGKKRWDIKKYMLNIVNWCWLCLNVAYIGSSFHNGEKHWKTIQKKNGFTTNNWHTLTHTNTYIYIYIIVFLNIYIYRHNRKLVLLFLLRLVSTKHSSCNQKWWVVPADLRRLTMNKYAERKTNN